MRVLLYILILIVAVGCGRSAAPSALLDEAQSLMPTDPLSALSKLNSVDVSELRDSSTLARWALLYSEAMAANSLSAPTDTIVNIAIDYYARHNMTAEYQKALQLKQLIRAGDDSDALATALYLQKEKEFLLYKERIRSERYMFAALLLILVAAGIIIRMRQHMREQSLRAEALMAEASGLKTQIDADRADVSRLQRKLHDMLATRFELIDSLCQTFYESQGTRTERKAIVEKVKSEIESIRSDSFPKMEQAVNDCCDGLLENVKAVCPDIKADDYQLLVYLAGGLSTRTVSLLVGESVDVVYKRKSRLKSRMKELVEPDCPWIMAVF